VSAAHSNGADVGAALAPVAVELSDVQLERLACLVAAKLQAPTAGRSNCEVADQASERPLLGVSELAERLAVSAWWVRNHADELGVVRLGPTGVDPGTGKARKPRLRFDEETARAALSRYTSETSQGHTPSADGTSEAPAPRSRRSLASRRPKPSEILPSRPRETAERASARGAA